MAQASDSRALTVMFLGFLIEIKKHGKTPKYPLEASDKLHLIQMKDFAQDPSVAGFCPGPIRGSLPVMYMQMKVPEWTNYKHSHSRGRGGEVWRERGLWPLILVFMERWGFPHFQEGSHGLALGFLFLDPILLPQVWFLDSNTYHTNIR